MPRNGSGAYAPPANSWNPANDGTPATSSDWNNTRDDFSNAITQSVSRDGQSPMTGPLPMGNNKITGLADGTQPTDAAAFGQLADVAAPRGNDFRLTVLSGTPVPVTDITAATTVYATPYVGNSIALYVSGNWTMRTSAQMSLALTGLTTARPYDIFCYDNAGVPTLEMTAWSSDTSRLTTLTYQDGVIVSNADATRRYLGTFYSTSATTTEDSGANRYLWNYYHRKVRRLYKQALSATWTYGSAVWRQAQAQTVNQVNFVVGISEDAISASYTTGALSSIASQSTQIGLAIDSTTSPNFCIVPPGSCNNVAYSAMYVSGVMPSPAGRHFIAMMEITDGTGTVTYQGVGNGGLSGSMMG